MFRELVTGCSIGPMTISWLITVRSKVVLLSSTNFHAACSAIFLDTLYPKTASWDFVASPSVTYSYTQLTATDLG